MPLDSNDTKLACISSIRHDLLSIVRLQHHFFALYRTPLPLNPGTEELMGKGGRPKGRAKGGKDRGKGKGRKGRGAVAVVSPGNARPKGAKDKGAKNKGRGKGKSKNGQTFPKHHMPQLPQKILMPRPA